ncbi:MAG TPA: hypothetical protein VMQ73_02235 [Methylomirabilota bacterium]|nr:hypothetical protein [Methylomirabilota bacterium]
MRRAAFILIFAAGCTGCDHAPGEDAASPAAQRSAADVRDSSLTKPERDAVRQQIDRVWLFDPGMPELDKMRVVVVVDLNRDGSVQSAGIESPPENASSNWKMFAESCIRAVEKSSPLRMPAGKPYEAWKRMILVFDAKEMFRQ